MGMSVRDFYESVVFSVVYAACTSTNTDDVYIKYESKICSHKSKFGLLEQIARSGPSTPPRFVPIKFPVQYIGVR